MKKPKIMKQSHENTFDNITPITGSIPSPVASQMSNMSNPNKIIKFIAGRDKGRKAKALKVSFAGGLLFFTYLNKFILETSAFILSADFY